MGKKIIGGILKVGLPSLKIGNPWKKLQHKAYLTFKKIFLKHKLKKKAGGKKVELARNKWGGAF